MRPPQDPSEPLGRSGPPRTHPTHLAGRGGAPCPLSVDASTLADLRARGRILAQAARARLAPLLAVPRTTLDRRLRYRNRGAPW